MLTVLHDKTNTLIGDARAQEISLFLTERACRPYLNILDQWIHKGTIVDPFQVLIYNPVFIKQYFINQYPLLNY